MFDSDYAYLPSLCRVVHIQHEVLMDGCKQEWLLAVGLHKCRTISLAHQCGSMS